MEIDNQDLKKLAKAIAVSGWIPGPNWTTVCRYCNCRQYHGQEQHADDCALTLAENLLQQLKGTKN